MAVGHLMRGQWGSSHVNIQGRGRQGYLCLWMWKYDLSLALLRVEVPGETW